jgi:Phytanoyl-CoA dioxygenase (PhyH)
MSAAFKLPVPMRELNESTHLVGNRAALDAVWERDGYWFFRDVLDLHAVRHLREVFLAFLGEYGLISPEDPQAHYTGASLEGFPLRLDPLSQRKVWRSFVREPAIDSFFRRLLQDEPFWVPTVEYRATPPESQPSSLDAPERIVFLHQDGFYNKGVPFRICWIPLSDIDEQVGGLFLGEGMHRGLLLHDITKPPLYPVPPGAVPPDRMRRATYRPGDVLLMDLNTPHTGLTNLSNRFRLSMDIRIMGMRDHPPIIGVLKSVQRDAVELYGEDGRGGRFRIDERSYRRGLDGKEVSLDEFTAKFKVGDEVLVGTEGERVTIIRPVH